MTQQEYLDLLYAASTDGTFPSVNHNGKCRYRADSTASCKQRCAIGILIRDEEYDPEMEVRYLEQVVALTQVPDGMTPSDMGRCQSAHDSVALIGGWDHNAFAEYLWSIPCFADCTHEGK